VDARRSSAVVGVGLAAWGLAAAAACTQRGGVPSAADAAPPPSSAPASASLGPADAGAIADAAAIADARATADAEAASASDTAPFDAGPNACRLVFGPVQQPATGPAAIAVEGDAVDVVTHQGAAARVVSYPVDAPPPAAKPVKKPLDGAADRASNPPCALAGALSFCADARGDVHRAARVRGVESPPGAVVAHGYAGARVAAARIGAHVVLGFLARRKTTEGWTSEAFAKVDDAEPAPLSEEGSGATEVDLVERGAEALALLVDARRAMTPLHARALRYEAKLAIGSDEVIAVSGGADAQVHGALATSHGGAAFALLPSALESGFGLLTVRIDAPPRMDEPTTSSPYLNGIDAAPIAATHGGDKVYVARVRPIRAEPASTRVLELGRIDGGSFTPLGIVPTAGSVRDVDVEIDRFGAIWLHYTDSAGSWVERRVC